MRAPGRREEDTSVRVLIWLPFIEGLQGPGRGASVGQVVHGGDPRHSAPPSQSIWQGPQRGRFLDVLLERGRGRRPLACCLSADGDQLPGAGQGRVRLRRGSRQGRESRAFISAHLGHTEQKQCIGLGSPAHCVPPSRRQCGDEGDGPPHACLFACLSDPCLVQDLPSPVSPASFLGLLLSLGNVPSSSSQREEAAMWSVQTSGPFLLQPEGFILTSRLAASAAT